METQMRLAKSQLAMLEKVFEAEINGRLPFQTKAKTATELVESGHLEHGEEMIHGVRVEGYWLTELGRMIYCQSCADVEIPPGL
jgi:hypothetical protein